MLSYCVMHKLCCPDRNRGFLDNDSTRPCMSSDGGYHCFERGHVGCRTSPNTTSCLGRRVDGNQNDICLAYGFCNLCGEEEVGLPSRNPELRICGAAIRAWREYGCIGRVGFREIILEGKLPRSIASNPEDFVKTRLVDWRML